jgi:hypothetical protein
MRKHREASTVSQVNPHLSGLLATAINKMNDASG